MGRHVIAVNGRFLTMSLSGVQRYAHEILRHVPGHLDAELRILVPPDLVLEGDEEELGKVTAGLRWHGVSGHRWEQLVLLPPEYSKGAKCRRVHSTRRLLLERAWVWAVT